MDSKKKDTIKILITSFLIGIVLLGVATFIAIRTHNIRESYDITSARIDEITTQHRNNATRRHKSKRTHSVYISYEYNGQKYEDVYYKYYNSSMRVGKTIKVYVNPNNPKQVESGNYTLAIIFAAFAIGVMIFGVGSSMVVRRMTR